jgi:diacylglycerol O-acyltransferase
LLLEHPAQPMHPLAVLLLEPPPGPGDHPVPVTLDDVRRHLAARVDAVPALRWRLKPVPLGLHHPVVYEDPGFDLNRHLEAVTLPAPGGPEELDRLVARLAEQPLDRGRPLWQLTLASGLDDGRQALLLQIHHVLMDGTALFNALPLLFGPEAPPLLPRTATAEPGRAGLVARAIADYTGALRRLPSLLGRTRRGTTALKKRRAAVAVLVPVPGTDAPACAVSAVVSGERRFARASLPLGEVLEVKRSAGTTVNDVALALAAGSLRSCLEARNDLPAKPLMACVLVALDRGQPEARSRTSGNQLANLPATLATDVADPWERLATISAGTREAREQLAASGPELLRDWLDVIPPFVSRPTVRRAYRRTAEPGGKIDYNVIVSNVRGPTTPLGVPGPEGTAVVRELFATGQPNNRLGAVFTCMDMGDQLLFSIMAVAGSIDPYDLAAGLHEALTELVKRARAGS